MAVFESVGRGERRRLKAVQGGVLPGYVSVCCILTYRAIGGIPGCVAGFAFSSCRQYGRGVLHSPGTLCMELGTTASSIKKAVLCR